MAVIPQEPLGLTVWLVTSLIGLYLWWVNRGMAKTPPDARTMARKPWTEEEIWAEYRRVEKAPTDVRPFLFSKTGRRYVVVGGSGLVGGWIVQHLLLRGEDPAAIRIVDLSPPTRPEVEQKKLQYVKTDISDAAALRLAFDQPWPKAVAKRSLTVFHTAAYINAGDRQPYSMPLYEKINVNGTRNVLDAARAAGASCFVSTSSASIAIQPISYWSPPWRTLPHRYFQVSVNGDPARPDGKLEDFGSCYAYSKMQAEKIVRAADDPKSGFRTGCIRPGHAIYGHGVKNASSVTYDYMRRGGSPTWIAHMVVNFVSAQNVSIAHLAYENKLLSDPGNASIGGRAYACTDPGGAMWYGDLYRLLATLPHPTRVVRFPLIPPGLMLLFSHIVEAYDLLRQHLFSFLPALTGDMKVLQPALFQMCTLHLVFDDRAAKEEIGYNPPITSLEGMCHQVIWFNQNADERDK